MADNVRHNCGWCVTHSLHDAHSFIGKGLQHRGRDAAGIAFIARDRIDVIRWLGPVDEWEVHDLHKIFPNHEYHTFMAHVRYRTRGREDSVLQDAHPQVIGGTAERMGSNLFLKDCEAAAVHNGQVDGKYFDGGLEQHLTTGCDTKALLHFYQQYREVEMLRRIPGAYSMAIAQKGLDHVIVMRDRTGIKPGVLGWKDGNYVAASEDIAITENGGVWRKDLTPGTAYYLRHKSKAEEKPKEVMVVPPWNQECYFEHNYIAHFMSVINGRKVDVVRIALGTKLAEEFPLEGWDGVTYIPRCPENAARAYASALNYDLFEFFFKQRAERSFMGGNQDERENSIAHNLFLYPDAHRDIEGKRLIVVDDSTIRGTNAARAAYLLYEAGAREVVILNYTPPIGIIGEDNIPRGCFFGVDMPSSDSFLVRTHAPADWPDHKTFKQENRTPKQINEALRQKVYRAAGKEFEQATSLNVHFLSVEGMLQVYEEMGKPRHKLCYHCIGGPHPFNNFPV